MKKEIAFLLCITLFGIILFVDTFSFYTGYQTEYWGAKTWPQLVSIAIIILAVVCIVQLLRCKTVVQINVASNTLLYGVGVVCSLAAYSILLEKIGYIIPTLVYLFLSSTILSKQTAFDKKNALYAITVTLISFVFMKMCNMPFV